MHHRNIEGHFKYPDAVRDKSGLNVCVPATVTSSLCMDHNRPLISL